MDAVVTAATMLVPLSVATGTPAVAVLNEVQRDWRYAPGQVASPMLPGVIQMWPPGDDGKPVPGEGLGTAVERACRSRNG